MNSTTEMAWKNAIGRNRERAQFPPVALKKYPVKNVERVDAIAAAVLVVPSMMEAYLGDRSWWPQNRPVLTQAPMPKQMESRVMTIAMVLLVTASGGVLLITHATAVRHTAPPPKHRVWDILRTSVLLMPPFSSLSAVGATMEVTATVARYGKMDRNEDLLRVTFKAEERKLGNHANKP